MIGDTVLPKLASLREARRLTKLAAAGALAAAMTLGTAQDAEASYGGSMADSDGYVPVYSTCYPGNQLGYYSWYFDGYTTYGEIYINECALQALGAGPNDRARVIEHEMGHARGLGHSSDPNSIMYPVTMITGT